MGWRRGREEDPRDCGGLRETEDCGAKLPHAYRRLPVSVITRLRPVPLPTTFGVLPIHHAQPTERRSPQSSRPAENVYNPLNKRSEQNGLIFRAREPQTCFLLKVPFPALLICYCSFPLSLSLSLSLSFLLLFFFCLSRTGSACESIFNSA